MDIEQEKANLQKVFEQRAAKMATAPYVLDELDRVYSLMKASKPNDRSEADRYWAIAITDMEKLLAFFKVYIA